MRTIELDALEIFRAVAREGGVHRAAEKLHRVPSNVTTRIKQMEERLGVSLFQRRGRTVVLTDAGRVLLTFAERLLDLAAQAETATRGTQSRGSLRIGSMESTAASRLPKIMATFHRRNPDIAVTVETGTTGMLIAKLRDYELDAAFVGEPFAKSGLNARPVFSERLVLVTAKSHSPVTRPRDLKTSTILAFSRGCSYRTRLETWLSDDRVAPERIMELASYQAIIACAAAGAGCGIMPSTVVETLGSARDIACHALPDKVAANTTHLAWLGDPSPQLQTFLAMLAKVAGCGKNFIYGASDIINIGSRR